MSQVAAGTSHGNPHAASALAAAAYDDFAPFYDDLCQDQDYEWWWSALLPLVERAGVPGRRVLDVACGTGTSLVPLLAGGWSGAGVDVSARMLEQARDKLGPEVPLHEHDMRELPELGAFDLVCVLNDAVNYLLDDDQLVEAFTGFRRNLVRGGVVVFDVNTLWTFRNYGVLVRQHPDRILMSEGNTDPDFAEGAIMPVSFTVLERRTGFFWQCHRSPLLQRHFSDAAIRRALRAAGLEIVGAYGQTYKTIADPLDEMDDEKAVYVARVPRDDEPQKERR
jgi:SAM-dependent methyltransferase